MRIVALGQALIRHPVDWPDDLRALVAGADSVLCNFEGCHAPPGTWPMKAKTVHPAHPQALAALRDLGVTHLAMANNHIWDHGHAGLLASRAAGRDAGLAVAGIGATLAEARRPALRNGVALLAVDAGPTPDWAIAGAGPGLAPLRMRRALGLPPADLTRLAGIQALTGQAERARRRQAVGYDAAAGAAFYGIALTGADSPQEVWTPDPADLDRLAEDIRAARTGADRVVVSIHYHHWSPDWLHPPDWLPPLARALAEAGADALFGHGPPVAYGLERAATMPFAPGLGNLVFHTARGPTYDRAGLPVWQGAALILEDAAARLAPVAALRPPT